MKTIDDHSGAGGAGSSAGSLDGTGGGTGGGGSRRDVHVAIIGSGFSGLGLAIRLRQEGFEDLAVFERADEVGGTWRDNTYPGCSCDVYANLYCFSFAPNPHWKTTFGKQPELLGYLRDCAERFGVRDHICFGHEVVAARWDEDAARWQLTTSGGHYTARVLVTATGYLSEPAIPSIPGLETFAGEMFHSSRWNHDVDLHGRRVAVIGTGASAIQFVPAIQPEVGRLDLYQRTPPWVGPKHDKPMPPRVARSPRYQRFRRNFNKWGREVLVFAMNRPRLMRKMNKMASDHLEKSVADPAFRARLTPDFIMGCKRVLFSDTYYPALQQPNVDLVTDGIREVRPHSVVSNDGTERVVDAIVLGTGFLATARPFAQRVWGRSGLRLADAWSDGMTAYRGTTVAGFPNMFMMLGPGTTSPHTSMTIMLEAQVDYVLDAVRTMADEGVGTVEVRSSVQDAYNERLQAQFAGTVWTNGGCNSWYLDANGRNTTLWPTFSWRFRRITKRFDLGSYEVTPSPVAAPSPLHTVAQEASA
jgi:cation diffusion facilitator CzcD-associated flavoprotein CzcO